MRKLMWFTIGFTAACGLSIYLLPVLFSAALGCMFLCGGISLVLLSKKIPVRICAVACLGLAAGMLWCGVYDTLRLAPIRTLDGQTQTITFTVSDYSFSTNYSVCADGTAEIDGTSCRIRAYVAQTKPLNPGDVVTGKFRLRYTAPGALEDVTYHSGKGILLLAYPKGNHTVAEAEDTSARYFASYLRRDILDLIGKIFPEDVSPFAKALLLGDTSQLSYKTDSDLSVSGLRHVAAVSGLHVSILCMLIFSLLGHKRLLRVALGIPILFVFSAVAGFSPSVIRASVMQGLMLLAPTVEEEYDPPTALSFAVLTMLAVNPLSVTSVSLQLSVASVGGILLFYEKIYSWIRSRVHFPKKMEKGLIDRIFGKIAASAAVSLSAWITTTPLTVLYFGSISLLSIVTNLLCLWAVTVLFCAIAGACLLGWFWLPAARAVAWLASWLARYVLQIAAAVAGLPLAAVYTKSIYILIWLAVCYGMIGLWLAFIRRRPMLLVSAAALLLCVAMLLSWGIPLLDNYRVTVLDVGQGQCVLLQSGGKTYMVDCGGSYDKETADIAAETLLSQGISRLDGLVLTHYDKDHVGAAAYLLQRVSADVLVLPEGDKQAQWDGDLLAVHRGKVLRGTRDLTFSWQAGELRIFYSPNTETSNESSLCVLFHTEKCDILITGDRSAVGEEILLNMADIPQLDALVVGHHGSAKSTGEILLAATRPKLALISVGEDNAYDHPEEAVLERLRAYDCAVRRTDLEGTILIRG